MGSLVRSGFTQHEFEHLYNMLDMQKDGIAVDELNFIACTGSGDCVGTPETILGGREAQKYETSKGRSRRSVKQGKRAKHHENSASRGWKALKKDVTKREIVSAMKRFTIHRDSHI